MRSIIIDHDDDVEEGWGGVDVPGAETDSPDADAMDGSAGPSSDTASTYRKKSER